MLCVPQGCRTSSEGRQWEALFNDRRTSELSWHAEGIFFGSFRVVVFEMFADLLGLFWGEEV